MEKESFNRSNLTKEFRWIHQLAHIMDSNFRIPGTRFRFGWDPILSLVPGAGNIISYVVSGILVIQMVRYGVSGKVALKMIGNVALDFIISVIPVIGTAFDAVYKANNRNVKLLNEHYVEGKHRGSATGIILTMVGVLLLVFVLLFYLVFKVLESVFDWIGSWF